MPVPASVPKWRFTADEYQRMVQARILTKYDRVELIDGGQSLAPELLPECVIATSDLLVE